MEGARQEEAFVEDIGRVSAPRGPVGWPDRLGLAFMRSPLPGNDHIGILRRPGSECMDVHPKVELDRLAPLALAQESFHPSVRRPKSSAETD